MFRRKARTDDALTSTDEDEVDEIAAEPAPRDAEEVSADELAGLIDLGSLLLPPPPDGLELRIQYDENVGQVVSILVAGDEGAVDLRAFAAPRNGDLWSDARDGLKADFAQHGAATDEREGPWGRELLAQLTVQLEDGQQAVQPQRVIGVNGPRWLMRATLLGRPAVEFDASPFDDVINSVVVRRGAGAAPVGEALPLTMPADATPHAGPQAGQDPEA